MTTRIIDLDDFKALDPFFRIIEKGLDGIALTLIPRGRLWLTERHRSRTCLASGYDAALVLKTNWGTGPSRSARELTDGWPSRNSSAHARLRRSQCPINNSRFDRLKPLSTAPARQWLSRDFRAGLWDQLLTATTGVVIRTTQQGKPRRCGPAR